MLITIVWFDLHLWNENYNIVLQMKSKNYFQEVCELLESGYTICESIDALSLDSRKFYATLSKEQILLMKKLTIANKESKLHNEDPDLRDAHEFFTSDYA